MEGKTPPRGARREAKSDPKVVPERDRENEMILHAPVTPIGRFGPPRVRTLSGPLFPECCVFQWFLHGFKKHRILYKKSVFFAKPEFIHVFFENTR